MKKLSILALAMVGSACLASCGVEVPKDIPGPHEFQGYKMVGEVKDGKRYLLAFYNPGEDYIRFISGKQHEDSKGKYPYYMGTVAGTVQGAAEVEIHYTDKTHFTMKVITDNEDWSNKYIGVYPATSAYSNEVLSIYAGSSVGEAHETDDCWYEYEFCQTFAGVNIYSVVLNVADIRFEDEPSPKMFGAGITTDKAGNVEEYISMDCTRADNAIDPETYHIAHFFEKM